MRAALAVAGKTMRYRLRGDLLFLVVIQPVIFIVVWGFCASLDLLDVRVAVLDQARTPASRAKVRALEASGAFARTRPVASVAELERALASGAASLGVVLPARGNPAVVADGTDPVVATIGLSYAVHTVAATMTPPPPPVAVRAWYNASLRGTALLLLGAICYNLVWFLTYPGGPLMDERDRGTLAVLALTPLRPWELWLGTVAPHLLVALWGTLSQVALVVAVAGTPLRGDPLLLFAGLALFGLVHVNLGCLVAALARTGAQRTLGQLAAVFLMLALSGFLIPAEYFPDWTRRVSELVPLTHGLRFVRGVFLRGASAEAMLPELGALAAFALASCVVGVLSARSLIRTGA